MINAASQPILCWERASVLDIIPVEAESPPDSIFLATHSNLAIYRRSNLQSSGGEIVHEDELLAAVADQPCNPAMINGRVMRAMLRPAWTIAMISRLLESFPIE